MIKCIRDGQSFTNLYDFQQHCKEFHPEIYNRMKVMRTLVQPKTIESKEAKSDDEAEQVVDEINRLSQQIGEVTDAN